MLGAIVLLAAIFLAIYVLGVREEKNRQISKEKENKKLEKFSAETIEVTEDTIRTKIIKFKLIVPAGFDCIVEAIDTVDNSYYNAELSESPLEQDGLQAFVCTTRIYKMKEVIITAEAKGRFGISKKIIVLESFLPDQSIDDLGQ